MRHVFLLFLFSVLCYGLLPAQVVVDLQRGGATVRPKTAEDYAREREERQARLERADTAAYRGCLLRAFAALGGDSLLRARELFEEALRLMPDAPGNSVVRHNIGRIHLVQGDYARAVEQFTAVLRRSPDARAVRHDRASAYLQMGYAKEAVGDCDILLRDEPADSLRAALFFLRAAARMKLRLFDDARRDLQQCLALSPDREGAALLLVMVLQQGGRPQEAMQRLNLFIVAHPRSADALALRAGMEAEQGMYEAARYDLDAAIAAEPSNSALYAERAKVL